MALKNKKQKQKQNLFYWDYTNRNSNTTCCSIKIGILLNLLSVLHKHCILVSVHSRHVNYRFDIL